jgi:hypothetical protein
LFKNIIPIEILAKMPLRFLHILRDIRLKQIEEKNNRIAQQLPQNRTNPTGRVAGGISADALEEMFEELS